LLVGSFVDGGADGAVESVNGGAAGDSVSASVFSDSFETNDKFQYQFGFITSVVILSLFGFSSFPSSIGSLFSPNVGVVASLLLSLLSTSEMAASPPPLAFSFVEVFSLVDTSSVAVTVAFWSFSVSGSESEFS